MPHPRGRPRLTVGKLRAGLAECGRAAFQGWQRVCRHSLFADRAAASNPIRAFVVRSMLTPRRVGRLPSQRPRLRSPAAGRRRSPACRFGAQRRSAPSAAPVRSVAAVDHLTLQQNATNTGMTLTPRPAPRKTASVASSPMFPQTPGRPQVRPLPASYEQPRGRPQPMPASSSTTFSGFGISTSCGTGISMKRQPGLARARWRLGSMEASGGLV